MKSAVHVVLTSLGFIGVASLVACGDPSETSTSNGGGGDTVGGTGGHADPGGSGGAPSGTGSTSGSGGLAGGGGGADDDPTPSSGCGSTTPPQSGTYTIEVDTTDADGQSREYILTLPDDYDSDHPYPLVFGWHPLGGSAQGVAGPGGFIGGYYGLQSRAGGSVIFVAGQGLPDADDNRGWPNTNNRDIAYLEAMLERFRSELCIDESRILSTGFSYGGMMSNLVACRLGDTFRAIAPMAGTLLTSYDTCVDERVAAILIHGTEDGANGTFGVPIDGGRNFRDYLIGNNGCNATSAPVEPSPCVAYDGCDAGYPITWCEFDGGHTVPNFASEAIWDFFSQFL